MGGLVLDRRPGESISIGPDIVVKIQKIEGRHAKVMIFAPEEMRILRTELLDGVSDDSSDETGTEPNTRVF